jgi:ABC-2 type transport system ATP-binding protein
VLILDEPTDGLDPNQRRDVLDLIARLGRERAVVLSTHILPEVESVCARVVILDRGRVIAAGTPAELADADRDLHIVARGDRARLAAAIAAVDGVLGIDGDGDVFRVRCRDDVRHQLARAIIAVGELYELRATAAGLERVFATLTGRA